jgi:hypothetical protein
VVETPGAPRLKFNLSAKDVIAIWLMDPMDTPPMSSTRSCISNLPNEILGEVFSYLAMTDTVEWNSAGRSLKAAQFTVLLHVSRVFRTIAMASNAILDWQFNFASLSSLIPGCNNTFEPWAIFSDKRLYASVTANEYLVRALARKREWTVRQPIDVFLTLLGGFPTRHQSIHKLSIVQLPREPARTPQIIYWELPAFADFALRHLSMCQHVVELAVEPGTAEPLSLDLIADGFPLLKHLKIVMTDALLEGSLESPAHLKSLEITAAVSRQSPEFDPDILPWGSAETLTTLSLNNITVDLDHIELSRFAKLLHFTHTNCKAQSLFIGNMPFTNWFKFRNRPYLETYECYTEPPEYPALSRCWSRLRSLTFRTVPPSGGTLDTDFITTWMDLLGEISDEVPDLREILFVNVGMDVGRLQCLSQLRSLKSITWVFERDFCQIQGEGTPEEALPKAFESFATKPKVKVIRNGDSFYGQSIRWPEHL